jgi:hypothetical protein
MAEASVQGRFLWESLLSADPAAATSFYGKVVGWKAAPWDADPTHTLFHAGVGPVADVTALSAGASAQGARGHWLTYIGTDDVDATVAQAQSLGAKVSMPAADLPIGRLAVLVDPQGGSFGVYKPNRPGTGKGTPQPGEAVWHELMTPDPEAALRFYAKLFGWQLIERMDMGPIGFYYIFGSGGAQYGGIFKPSQPLAGPPSAWVLYVSVPDADAAAEAASKLGGKLCHGPTDVPGGGRIAQLQDPSGVFFAVHSMKAPATASTAAARPAAASKPRPARKPTAPSKPESAAQPAERAAATPKAPPAAPAKVPAPKPAAAAAKPPSEPVARKVATKAAGKVAKKAAKKPAKKPAKKAAAKAAGKAVKKASRKSPARKAAPARQPAARKVARKPAGPDKLELKRLEKARRKAEKARRKKEKDQKGKKDKKDKKKRKKNKKGRRKK